MLATFSACANFHCYRLDRGRPHVCAWDCKQSVTVFLLPLVLPCQGRKIFEHVDWRLYKCASAGFVNSSRPKPNELVNRPAIEAPLSDWEALKRRNSRRSSKTDDERWPNYDMKSRPFRLMWSIVSKANGKILEVSDAPDFRRFCSLCIVSGLRKQNPRLKRMALRRRRAPPYRWPSHPEWHCVLLPRNSSQTVRSFPILFGQPHVTSNWLLKRRPLKLLIKPGH